MIFHRLNRWYFTKLLTCQPAWRGTAREAWWERWGEFYWTGRNQPLQKRHHLLQPTHRKPARMK